MDEAYSTHGRDDRFTESFVWETRMKNLLGKRRRS
jgi:hypothetical protein